jgi:PAS domain S-box-containing protein
LIHVAAVSALTIVSLFGGIVVLYTLRRKRWEKEQRASEERLRRLHEAAPDAIVVIDPQTGRFDFANENAARLFETDHTALRRVGPVELSPPIQPDGRPSAEAFRERLEEAISGTRPVFEWHYRNASGQIFPCEVRLVRLPAEGRPLVRGSILDIRPRQGADQALRESEERLHLALSGADLGLWDWDIPTGQATFNERWAEMLGYRLEEIEHSIRFWQRIIHPEDRFRVLQRFQAHMNRESPSFESEFRVRCRDGTFKWVLCRGKVLKRDGRDKPLRAAGTTLDITRRRRA